MTVDAYIALGSNLDDPMRKVCDGLDALNSIPDTKLVAQSSWYGSKAIGPGEQPDYVNGVAKITTALSAQQLLTALQAIEAKHGRERRVRWAARTLDLDILLFGSDTVADENLSIPHPRLMERNFVLYPLAEISPELTLPNGLSLQSLLARCPAEGLVKIRI
ncbi:2-amino-4-hydroxy-6-hydroxymethyldihydropteridine diphosphokinase [Aurantivibrio infirmus]